MFKQVDDGTEFYNLNPFFIGSRGQQKFFCSAQVASVLIQLLLLTDRQKFFQIIQVADFPIKSE